MNSSFWNSVGGLPDPGESNLTSCVTHWLYTSMPPYLQDQVSNQSVAGQPVAVSDSMPRHHGVLPSDLILSVSAFSSSMCVGAV